MHVTISLWIGTCCRSRFPPRAIFKNNGRVLKKLFEQFIDANEKLVVSDKANIAILLLTVGDKANDIFEKKLRSMTL